MNLDQLQHSIGSQYRLERELGGGGMSRVFLAEESGLGRRVVLKLLPPELAAVLSVDRFQREVRLAAALQHPHVVPLLAAGKTGDIFYYTMPFIEGESLRARLAREGELPVGETVRLLREVADALAYAHAQGIVHRDIKPDNILLSHGHAVVTDFGIAKALTAAGGSGTLTATGVAIGTPTYMAPEQATGDAQVDQRADLYSLGALAYEMLAGEPPFRGSTAQALIAAQLTRSAAPLTEARPAVPAELAAIIHRCLEKRPADRFQHAGELRAALDDLSFTPSGSTLTRAAAAAATREWPLAQVLGGFALAAALTLGLAWGLRQLIGLPDWFFPAAVVLLALGLPVVVLATLRHNARARGAVPTPTGLGRRLTLRNAVLGGVAAFAGLGLVTGAFMAMRALGIGPVGTLVASGKLAERERLLIADFANRTRDSLLGPAVTQAIRVDLTESRKISLVEPDFVRRVLQRMQRPDTTALTLEVAREVAQRGGLKAVVGGELQQVGPSIMVSAQIVNAESGEVLASAREEASDSTRILEAVDRVSKRLRERIGESLKVIRASPALADVSTGSLEALRRYSQAIQAENGGDNPRAVKLLESAVAADSGFAMAWRKLGVMLMNETERIPLANEAITRAFQGRERLTFRERKLTENSYYSDVRGQPDSSIAALEALLVEYPNDSWGHNNLGVMYSVSGNIRGAEQEYRRSAALEPDNLLAIRNLFFIQIAQGLFDSAGSTLRDIQQRFPVNPALEELELLLLLGRRDFTGAEAWLRAGLARAKADPRVYGRRLRWFSGVLMIRGKLAEADRTFSESARLFASRGVSAEALVERARSSLPMAVYREDRQAAAARIEAALREFPLEAMPPKERPLWDVLNATTTAGMLDRSEALVREFEQTLGNFPARFAPGLRPLARAAVLRMRAETVPQAIVALRAHEGAGCVHCIEAIRGLTFDQAGQGDSALVHYQRWAEVGEGTWSGGFYTPWHPVVYLRLGELYTERGDTNRATEFFGKFTELWKEADPELQPKVRDIKRRIAELVAEPRR